MTESAASSMATPEVSTVQYSEVQTEAPASQYGSSHAGLIIGILLTIISLLLGAILYVVYQVSDLTGLPLLSIGMAGETVV